MTELISRATFRCGLLASIAAITACAHVPTDPAARAEYDKANDPAEPTNRAIFAANQFVDRLSPDREIKWGWRSKVL